MIYNSTNTCDKIKKIGFSWRRCGNKLYAGQSYKDYVYNKKKRKWTGKWLCQECYKKEWIANNKYKNECYKLDWYLENTNYNRFDENEYCPDFIGEHIGEDKFAKPILDKIFGYVEKKKRKNIGFDFLCRNPKHEFIDKFRLETGKEYKIDIKTARLRNAKYSYQINYNNVPDIFILIATNDEYSEDKITCHHIWIFSKNDMVRIKVGAGYRDTKFFDRIGIAIPNKVLNLKYFSKWRMVC